MSVLAKKNVVGKSQVTLRFEGRPTPSVREDVSRLIPDFHGPGCRPGFPVACAVHNLDGTIGVFPPLEPGRLEFPQPVAEHNGSVAVPGRGEQAGQLGCTVAGTARVQHGGGGGMYQEPWVWWGEGACARSSGPESSFQILVDEGRECAKARAGKAYSGFRVWTETQSSEERSAGEAQGGGPTPAVLAGGFTWRERGGAAGK